MADKTINQLTEDTSPTTDDYIPMWDTTSSTSKKFSFSSLKAFIRGSFWWEELGRTTLGGAADSISVTGLTARKHLLCILDLRSTGGTINCIVRFNNDSAGNYANRTSTDGAADATAGSGTAIFVGDTATTTSARYAVFNVLNLATAEKLVLGWTNQSGAVGAANVPSRRETAGKWSNVVDQITRVDAINSAGTGDFASGSALIVLGKD